MISTRQKSSDAASSAFVAPVNSTKALNQTYRPSVRDIKPLPMRRKSAMSEGGLSVRVLGSKLIIAFRHQAICPSSSSANEPSNTSSVPSVASPQLLKRRRIHTYSQLSCPILPLPSTQNSRRPTQTHPTSQSTLSPPFTRPSLPFCNARIHYSHLTRP